MEGRYRGGIERSEKGGRGKIEGEERGEDGGGDGGVKEIERMGNVKR